MKFGILKNVNASRVQRNLAPNTNIGAIKTVDVNAIHFLYHVKTLKNGILSSVNAPAQVLKSVNSHSYLIIISGN